MASVNKVILVANLGRDPETRFMPNGNAVANCSMATTETWKDKASGEKKEATEWHRVVFFGRLAEIVGEYLHSGSQVYIEGRLQTRKYDKDGQTHYSTEIVADKMVMLGSKRDRDSDIDDIKDQPKTAARPAAGGGSFADLDDDVPFDRLARGIGGHAT